jgi:hypothetical protein
MFKDNARKCQERFFKTLKYDRIYVNGIETSREVSQSSTDTCSTSIMTGTNGQDGALKIENSGCT